MQGEFTKMAYSGGENARGVAKVDVTGASSWDIFRFARS